MTDQSTPNQDYEYSKSDDSGELHTFTPSSL